VPVARVSGLGIPFDVPYHGYEGLQSLLATSTGIMTRLHNQASVTNKYIFRFLGAPYIDFRIAAVRVVPAPSSCSRLDADIELRRRLPEKELFDLFFLNSLKYVFLLSPLWI